jgi:hypothetical protein
LKLERSIDNLAKRLNRLDPLLPTSHVPSGDNRTGLSHWKGRPVIALEDWIQIRGNLPYRLAYFPDDSDQTLTYMELPYYQYEFEHKRRRLEAKRRSDEWLNEEIGYGAICHDSRGNLVDRLGNPNKEEEVVEEEEQDRDEELRLRLKLKQEQEDIEKWHSDYIELMEYIKNPNYISHCADAKCNSRRQELADKYYVYTIDEISTLPVSNIYP